MAEKPENGVNESWLKLITKVGLSGAIGAFLVYQLSQDVSKKVTSVDESMKAHVQTTNDMRWAVERLVMIQLADCVNQAGARTNARDLCFRASRGERPTP